ncbi:hypothetical protein M271_08020 [Streptomyces rapamycinicus NRRL 5491]|uniref:Phosphotyrosine protein phosphatase I domain-containing protein n=2 Tax=Streptomyces rapamycinicus TaxID=1226757 RepID=A0A0A0N8X0_STRRN|nr:hypothetical protein M271_08020 [Streptomyces rapamycinicus NRRL 5491]MBB4780710.1 protein-tyrosine-phosphatase [Streptomyces rapamycinicus]RLV74640.1 hypothetical protein D3C57_135480 [Streptomyces rapamycinicus NRRL 5491]
MDAGLPRVLFVCSHNAGRAPVVPGRRYLDWPVADPDGAPSAAVRAIRDEIDAHISDLFATLPGT